MKTLYLVLAIVGAVLPYGFFVRHFSSEGVSLTGFVAALFANPAAVHWPFLRLARISVCKGA